MAQLTQPSRRRSPWVRIGLALLFAALVVYVARPPAKQPPEGPPHSAADPEPDTPAKQAPVEAAESEAQATVEDVEIYDLDGTLAFRGTVDLTPTLSRIQSGQPLRFPNDGSVFQNRERRLPRQPAGYYREWVHPTPVLPGPGPQRVVTGEHGEVFYTPDHYRTFRRFDE